MHSNNLTAFSRTALKAVFPALGILVLALQVSAQHPRLRTGQRLPAGPAVNSKVQDEASLKSNDNDRDDDNEKLDGTWNGVAIAEDGFEIPLRYTFISSGKKDGGSLILTTVFDSDSLFTCGPAQGDWKKTGNRRFKATFEQSCIDKNGIEPEIEIFRLQDTIRLNRNGREFTATEKFEARDLEGNLLFSAPFIIRARRLDTSPF